MSNYALCTEHGVESLRTLAAQTALGRFSSASQHVNGPGKTCCVNALMRCNYTTLRRNSHAERIQLNKHIATAEAELQRQKEV